MKKIVLIALMAVGVVASASAQRDDLYFVPKKKKVAVEQVKENPVVAEREEVVESTALSANNAPSRSLEMDEDAYNRRGSYLTDQGDAVSEFAMSDEGFVLITEEGDTMWMNTDTLRLTRVEDGDGWVNGFDGSDSDYEYAMRIIRFRNPRYAIPVSSPLYWDVVYGSALWPTWEWNIYDDGMYAYVFPTSSNWYYWDYVMSYPFGWSAWGSPWYAHHGCHWGHHAGWQFYGHVWYDPWFNPYFSHYHPGWHHGHHHGYYPNFGMGKPVVDAPKAYPNYRTSTGASTRRDTQAGVATERSTATVRTDNGTATRRIDNGSSLNSSARVVNGNTGAVRTSGSGRTTNSEVIHRSTGSSSVSRGTSATSGGYTRQSTSRSTSGSSSSYNRPSSTRSTSTSVSRSTTSSGSSRTNSYSGSSSSSSRSSSYSSGSSRSSSFSGSSSYSGSSSRSSGGSYGGGSSSRSSSSGSRR